MNPIRITTGLALLTVTAGLVHAEPAPYQAGIQLAEVDVRSGPSMTAHYATSKLRLGETVTVLREQDGFYAIKPPQPNSFSWVHGRFLKIDRTNKTAVVLNETPVRIGSEIPGVGRPFAEGPKLHKGHQVVLLRLSPFVASNEEREADNGTWYPVAPTEQEVRYIPKEAVKTPVEVASKPMAPPASVGPASGAEALYQQAEQAAQAGNLVQARQLLQQAADANPDINWKNRCYTRISSLGAGPPSVIAGGQPVAGQTMSFQRPQPVQVQSAYGGGLPPLAVHFGTLRRSGFNVDGRPTYALVDSSELPQMYVTAQPGLALEPFVNRMVRLHGTVVYRADLRKNYMVAYLAFQQ